MSYSNIGFRLSLASMLPRRIVTSIVPDPFHLPASAPSACSRDALLRSNHVPQPTAHPDAPSSSSSRPRSHTLRRGSPCDRHRPSTQLLAARWRLARVAARMANTPCDPRADTSLDVHEPGTALATAHTKSRRGAAVMRVERERRQTPPLLGHRRVPPPAGPTRHASVPSSALVPGARA